MIACLHRSDPEHQGAALSDLLTAVSTGRLVGAICCAESTRDAYRDAGVPETLLHVVPNGVDLARFRPLSARRRAARRGTLGVPSDATVVLFAARYDRMKNVELFLRSARAFVERDGASHVLMCGAGMSTTNTELVDDALAVFADRPDLLPRLHLLGVRRDMETVYAAADVVALTSSFGEAAPLCLIEGAMCGAVPVTTDVGDSASIVDGIGLVTSTDPMEISAAWVEAASRRDELGLALLRSRPRFSHTRMIAGYSTVIERIHRGSGSRSACDRPRRQASVTGRGAARPGRTTPHRLGGHARQPPAVGGPARLEPVDLAQGDGLVGDLLAAGEGRDQVRLHGGSVPVEVDQDVAHVVLDAVLGPVVARGLCHDGVDPLGRPAGVRAVASSTSRSRSWSVSPASRANPRRKTRRVISSRSTRP
ncbi:glycosyltransferase [Oerskovia sp. M15]